MKIKIIILVLLVALSVNLLPGGYTTQKDLGDSEEIRKII